MIYPKFIEKGGTVGICAPSAGIGHKLDKYLESIEVLNSLGYKVIETKSVRKNNPRSTSAKNRAKEIDELITNPKVDIVSCATGGDYMYEILPYINFENIKKNPKWIFGLSDPTNLLYLVTTYLDIATIYGHNGAGYTKKLSKCKKDNLDFMKGKISKQVSYKKCQSFYDTINDVAEVDKDVKWISKSKELKLEGRLIGGCIEILRNIIGTKYDHTLEFLERYKDDGFIWYFDVFSLSSLDYYLTLLQFKNAGWFKYCKGVLIGRVAFEKVEDPKLDYIKASNLALKGIPHINEMDIGHTYPSMTLINGAKCIVNYKDGKGDISFKLK